MDHSNLPSRVTLLIAGVGILIVLLGCGCIPSVRETLLYDGRGGNYVAFSSSNCRTVVIFAKDDEGKYRLARLGVDLPVDRFDQPLFSRSGEHFAFFGEAGGKRFIASNSFVRFESRPGLLLGPCYITDDGRTAYILFDGKAWRCAVGNWLGPAVEGEDPLESAVLQRPDGPALAYVIDSGDGGVVLMLEGMRLQSAQWLRL